MGVSVSAVDIARTTIVRRNASLPTVGVAWLLVFIILKRILLVGFCAPFLSAVMNRVESLKSWGALFLIVLAVLNLQGLEGKLFALFIYLFCLFPMLIFWRKVFAHLKESRAFWFALVLFAAYAQLSSFIMYGRADSQLKYVALLLLFFGFVKVAFSDAFQVERLHFGFLIAAGALVVWALFVHPFQGSIRYDFGGVNANRSAAFFCFVFCWAIWEGLQRRGMKAFVLIAVGLLLVIATFALLKSRSILLCLAFFMVGVLLFGRSSLSPVRLVLFVLLVALVGALVVSLEPFRSWFLERGGSYRLEIWSDGFAYMESRDCYLMGCGSFDGYRFLGLFDNPHGLIFSTFYYYGGVGLGLFIFFLIVAFLKISGFYRAWLFGFLGFSIFTHVGVLAAPTLIWIYFWLPLALGLQERRKHA